jgi:hypothetical protein
MIQGALAQSGQLGEHRIHHQSNLIPKPLSHVFLSWSIHKHEIQQIVIMHALNAELRAHIDTFVLEMFDQIS